MVFFYLPWGSFSFLQTWSQPVVLQMAYVKAKQTNKQTVTDGAISIIMNIIVMINIIVIIK